MSNCKIYVVLQKNKKIIFSTKKLREMKRNKKITKFLQTDIIKSHQDFMKRNLE